MIMREVRRNATLALALTALELGRGMALVGGLAIPHIWLNLAAAGSEPAAQRERDLIAKNMTRSQIAEAIRLARAWKPMATALPPSETSDSTGDHHRP